MSRRTFFGGADGGGGSPPSFARVARFNSTQSIGNGAWVPVEFNTLSIPQDWLEWDIGAPSEFTFLEPGVYILAGEPRWDTNQTGYRFMELPGNWWDIRPPIPVNLLTSVPYNTIPLIVEDVEFGFPYGPVEVKVGQTSGDTRTLESFLFTIFKIS
jgi:hypothetical protein